MKQQVSPGVVAVIVVVVLAIIGVIGFKVLGHSGGNAINSPGMKERYDAMTKNAANSGGTTPTSRPPGVPTGGSGGTMAPGGAGSAGSGSAGSGPG